MMEIKLGTDPEMFLIDGDGTYVSAHDLVPGTKKQPFGVVGGAIQPDGVAAEFNIYPHSNPDDFLGNIRHVQTQLLEKIHEKRPDLELVANPTAFFDQEYFDSLPKQAKLLGCEPDFNAYTKSVNPKPGTDRPMRTGAFHVHIGFTEFVDPMSPDHFEKCCEIVRQLDSTLYPLSMTWDSDETRRELYGAKGSFRPKFYGLEYRPLSNAVLRDDETIRLVFETTYSLVRDYFDGIIHFDLERAVA